MFYFTSTIWFLKFSAQQGVNICTRLSWSEWYNYTYAKGNINFIYFHTDVLNRHNNLHQILTLYFDILAKNLNKELQLLSEFCKNISVFIPQRRTFSLSLTSVLFWYRNRELSNTSCSNWSMTFQNLGFRESGWKYDLAAWMVYRHATVLDVSPWAAIATQWRLPITFYSKAWFWLSAERTEIKTDILRLIVLQL